MKCLDTCGTYENVVEDQHATGCPHLNKLYRVKPLVWTDTPKRSWASIPSAIEPVSAWYETEEVDRDDNYRMIVVFDSGHAHISDPAPLEDMKAAAQRDYEARLLAQGVIEEIAS